MVQLLRTLLTGTVEDFPEGYPQLAAIIQSDNTFASFRQFGRLSTRILLQLQNELTEIESQVDQLDASDAQDETMKYRVRGSENYVGWDTVQQDLVKRARIKWHEYST